MASRNFDLSKYETVQERINRFYTEYPQGRIVTELIEHNHEHHYVLFAAFVFAHAEDQNFWASGHAQEFRDMELSKSRSGGEYESVNYSSYIENCETSAIGRALANAGYSGSKGSRPSREEMQKAQRMEQARQPQKPAAPAKQPVDAHTKRKAEEAKAEDVAKTAKLSGETLSGMFGLLKQKGYDTKDDALKIITSLAVVADVADLSELDGQKVLKELNVMDKDSLDMLLSMNDDQAEIS